MDAIRASYPRLPDIMTPGALAALATLERKEIAFARRQGRIRHQYLRALYGQIRSRVADETGHDANALGCSSGAQARPQSRYRRYCQGYELRFVDLQ